VVSNILKLFLPELPEPLVLFSLYHPLLALTSEMDSEEKVQKSLVHIKSLLNTIPPPHHRVLHFICLFLREIGSNSEVTKMGVDNLAIVFASNILRPDTNQMDGRCD